MKQIKTIKNRLDNAEIFDDEVNAALAEGWCLTRREVIRPNAHPVGETSFTMLYAELEREIPESKRCCEACGTERCTDAPCLKEEPQDATI